jgi:hypothetical protein
MSRNISSIAFADDDDKPSRKAHKIAAVAATVAAGVNAWFSRRVAIAAAVLRKIGTVKRGADDKDYVVAESARRKIADLLQHHPAANLPATTYFTQFEWQSIPPCPIQRDTEKHLNRCREKFFTVTVSQKTVFIAVQDDGDIYKLEGHTRTYGWESGLVPADQIPELLNVVIHFTEDYDGTLSEYKTFDDSTQSKNGSDQLFAAYRENDLHPVPHGFLYNCTGVVDALRTAFTTLAQHELISKSMLKRATETQNLKKRCPPKLEECVKRFKPALKALDKLNPPARLFKGVVTRVFLLAYTKYVVLGLGGPDAEKRLMTFFTDYRDGNGKQLNGKFDALQNFREIHKDDSGGEKHRTEKMPKLLGAIERYIENGPNKMYTIPGAVNMEIYFTSRTALNKGNAAREKKKKKRS